MQNREIEKVIKAKKQNKEKSTENRKRAGKKEQAAIHPHQAQEALCLHVQCQIRSH